MERRWLIGAGVAVAVLFFIFVNTFTGEEVAEVVAPEPVPTSAPEPITVPTPTPAVVNFEQYNYDYVDENVKGILNRMLGTNGKTAFYLPAVGYVNVSRGDKYGVAYALNNPNPSGENYFEFNWTAGETTCGVGLDVARGWIERGGFSWGKIGEGWIDHMTVYFSFPADVDACSVRYDFVITKDGAAYDSKSVLFNLI